MKGGRRSRVREFEGSWVMALRFQEPSNSRTPEPPNPRTSNPRTLDENTKVQSQVFIKVRINTILSKKLILFLKLEFFWVTNG